KYWPGSVSLIFDCPDKNLRYLHRGSKSLAFRLPKDKVLIKILKKTGPLVAPSANPEGKEPAKTAEEAREYFGNQVDLYTNAKAQKKKPSTLVSLINNEVKVLRQGAVKISQRDLNN